MAATGTAPPGSRRRANPATVTGLFAVLTTVAYLLLPPSGGAGPALWFPPAGLAFGYLLVVGRRGAPAVASALVLGGLLRRPDVELTTTAATLSTAAATALWYTVVADVLRRVSRGGTSYATLTRFVVLGVTLAPLGSATATEVLGVLLQNADPDPGRWARGVLGEATAIATLVPAFHLVERQATTGRRSAPAVPRRRRWELVGQALVVVTLPALFLLASAVTRPELLLVPVALVPLAWLAVDTDQPRAAVVLATTGVLLGAVGQFRFGEGEPAFRLQVVLFAGAVAALFAGASLAAEDRSRRGAALDSTRWRALVEAAPVVVARVSADGRWRAEGADGELRDVVARARRAPEVAAALAAGGPSTAQWGVDGDTGRRFVTRVTPLPDGERLVVTTETTRVHSAEIALAWERSHDRETDLPNRDLLVATADQLASEGGTASLVLLDVDEATSHAALLDVDPARLLLVLAERLRDLLDPAALARGTALVARVGENRFAVLVPGDVGVARRLADDMVAALRAPVPAGGAVVAVPAWAGVAALDGDRGARESLRRAEAALQAAAEHGRGHVAVLDGLSVRTSAERARLSGEVAHALDRRELEVVFQPDVDLATGRLTGVEALVRWRRREGFAAPTETFVRLAEELGAVQAVDAWVLEESLRALGAWRAAHGADDLELGVNVSAYSLTPDLPRRLLEACRRHGVPPSAVRLEVTETALADDGAAVEVLHAVRAGGCRVALDDFGTGYATLSRLHRLPVDVLKLDRSFLPALARDTPSQALVSLVLGLAGPLQVDVVAEGVETQEQRELLLDLGCRRAQGYLFSRATTAGTVAAMLSAGTPLVEPVAERALS